MPGGLEAPIAQGGSNVSGGQRQRLAIARALVRRPGIYLFDDSFSALDLATDAHLRAALAPEVGDAVMRHRRPAGVHHHQRRPDPRHRGRPPGRARDAPRAARDLSDVRRDRGVPAHRGGGGVTDEPQTPDEAEASRSSRPRRCAAVACRAGGAPRACRSSARRTSRTRPAGSRPGSGPRASASRWCCSSRSRASRCS